MAAEFSGAMPRLYGAPAYTRPPSHGSDAQRPFDPDDLPLECYRVAAEHVDEACLLAETESGDDWLFRATRSPFGFARR